MHWRILAFSISLCHPIKYFIHSTSHQFFISLSTILRWYLLHFLHYNSQPNQCRILGIVFLVQAYTSPKNQWTLRGNHHFHFKNSFFLQDSLLHPTYVEVATYIVQFFWHKILFSYQHYYLLFSNFSGQDARSFL